MSQTPQGDKILDILDRDEQLRGLSLDQKVGLFDQLKTSIGERQDLSPGHQRRIRDVLNESSAAASQRYADVGLVEKPRAGLGFAKPTTALLGGGFSPEQVEEARAFQGSDFSTLSDKMKTGADFVSELPGALVRVPYQLASLATYIPEGAEWLVNKTSPGEPVDVVSQSMAKTREYLGGKIRDLSKDDPEMAELADSVMLDFVVGGLLAPLSGGTSYAALGAGKGALQAARFGASSVAGGQVFLQSAIPAIQEIMQNDDLSENTKTGLLIGSAVVGLVAGIGVEQGLNALKSTPRLAESLDRIGSIAAEEGGVDLYDKLLQNKSISDEFKQMLEGLRAEDPNLQSQMSVEDAFKAVAEKSRQAGEQEVKEVLGSREALAQAEIGQASLERTAEGAAEARKLSVAELQQQAELRKANAVFEADPAVGIPLKQAIDDLNIESPVKELERMEMRLSDLGKMQEAIMQEAKLGEMAGEQLGDAARKLKEFRGEEVPPAVRDWLNLDDQMMTLSSQINKLKADMAEAPERVRVGTQAAKKPIFSKPLSKHEKVLAKTPRFRQLFSAAKSVLEARAGGQLGPKEYALLRNVTLRTMTQYDDKAGKLLAQSDKLVVPINGTPVLNMIKATNDYPLVAQLMKTAREATGGGIKYDLSFFSETFGKYMSSLGRGLNDAAYEARRGLTEEINRMWDAVVEQLPPATIKVNESLEQALESLTGSGTGKLPAEQIAELKQKLPLHVRVLREAEIPTPVSGMYSLLSDTISISKTASNPVSTLLHDLGHHIFFRELKTEDRIAFLDMMRKYAASPENWEKAFPDLAKVQRSARLAAQNGDRRTSLLLQKYANDPLEAFAQQTLTTILGSTLPTGKGATAMQKALRGLSDLLKIGQREIGRLPEELEDLQRRLLNLPDLRRIADYPKADFSTAAGRTGGLIPTRTEDALRVLEEQAAEIDLRYGEMFQQLEINPSSGLIYADGLVEERALGEVFAPELIQNPSIAKAQMLSLEDLPKAVEVEAMRAFLNRPEFDPVFLQAMLSRYARILRPDAYDELTTKILGMQGLPVKFEGTGGIDPMTGGGRLARGSEQGWRDARLAMDAARGDPLALEIQAFAQKKLQAFARGYEMEEQALGRKLTMDEKRVVRARVGESLGGLKPKTWDWETSVVQQHVKAMQAHYDLIEEFAQEALRSRGLVEAIPPEVVMGYHMADAIDRTIRGDVGAIAMYGSLAARGLMVGVAGITDDPENGILTPFGRISWSLDALLDRGAWLSLALAPGVYGGSKFLLKKGAGKIPSLVKRLSPAQQQTLSNLARNFKKNWFPSGLLGEESDMLKQAFVRRQAAIKGDWMELADTLSKSFTKEERSLISMMASGDYWPGWEASTNPRVQQAAEMVKGLYKQATGMLKEVGIPEEKLEEVSNYMNRVYLSKIKQKGEGYFKGALKPKGIDGGYFIERGLVHQVGGGTARKSAMADGIIDAGTEQKQLLEELRAIDSDKMPRVNSYTRDVGGSDTDLTRVRLYAVSGSARDKALQADKLYTKDALDWKVEKFGDKGVSLRRDFNFHERSMLGETMDAPTKVAMFGRSLSEDIAKNELFKKIASDPERVSGIREMMESKGLTEAAAKEQLEKMGWKIIPDDTIPGTDIPKFGSLSGKAVSPETYDLLESTRISRGCFAEWLSQFPLLESLHRKGLYSFKIGKTALSIGTHVNNAASNVIAAVMHGENPLTIIRDGIQMMRARSADLRVADALKRGDVGAMERLIAQAEQSSYRGYLGPFREAKAAQIGDSTLISSESRVSTFLDEAERMVQDFDATSLTYTQQAIKAVDAVETGISRHILKGVTDAAQRGIGSMAKFYEGGDLIFKYGLFKQMLDRGASTEEALKRVYDIFFDYSSLPSGVRFFRDTGLSPFVSYQYKATLMLGKLAWNDPGKLAALGLVAEGVHYRTMASIYGMENAIQGEEFERRAQTPYRKKRSFGLIRQNVAYGTDTVKDSEGNAVDVSRYVGLGQVIPGGDLFSTGESPSPLAMATSVSNFFTGAATQNPMFATMFAMLYGRDPNLDTRLFQGPDIPEDVGVQARKWKEVGKYIARTWTPNFFLNPVAYPYERLMQGLTNDGVLPPDVADYLGYTGYNTVGMPHDLGTQIQNIVGLKTYNFDPEDEMVRRMDRIEKAALKGNSYLKWQAESPAVSETALAREEEYVTGIQERAAGRLEKMGEALSKGAAARDRIKALRQGTIRPALAQ